MSKVIGVMGESGSGKTTAMRNLDPSTTFYIDCDKKGLSWKGWRDQYEYNKRNYQATDNIGTVQLIISKISGEESMKHIKTVSTKKLQNTVKKGGCGECQTSCQSACKTSCTVGNQTCEKAAK